MQLQEKEGKFGKALEEAGWLAETTGREGSRGYYWLVTSRTSGGGGGEGHGQVGQNCAQDCSCCAATGADGDGRWVQN